jgi:hypothetical protein
MTTEFWIGFWAFFYFDFLDRNLRRAWRTSGNERVNVRLAGLHDACLYERNKESGSQHSRFLPGAAPFAGGLGDFIDKFTNIVHRGIRAGKPLYLSGRSPT